MCFVGIWEQTAIISQYNVNWNAIIYFAVWTESLHVIQINQNLQNV